MTQLLKILHIVGSVKHAGVQTWLIHVQRHLRPREFQMDWLVRHAEPGGYQSELEALGSQLFVIPGGAHETEHFNRVMEQGAYDIVHVHTRHSHYLKMARRAGNALLVPHSHGSLLGPTGPTRRLLFSLWPKHRRDWQVRRAPAGLACSGDAARELFGKNWQKDTRWRVLFCGIDLRPFAAPAERAAVRAEFGFPPGAWIVTMTGRLEKSKNHAFFLEIARDLAQRDSKIRFLVIGDGTLREKLTKSAAGAGLREQVRFAGFRNDVPRLLKASDLFLFPSQFEGLGLALIEAQAAGLPCVFSDVLPAEAGVVKPMLTRASLDAPAKAWADAVWRWHERPGPIAPAEALRTVVASPFNVETSAAELVGFYRQLAAQAKPCAVRSRV